MKLGQDGLDRDYGEEVPKKIILLDFKRKWKTTEGFIFWGGSSGADIQITEDEALDRSLWLFICRVAKHKRRTCPHTYLVTNFNLVTHFLLLDLHA